MTEEKKRGAKGQYRCLKDSYLGGKFYQKGKIVALSSEFAKKFPSSFQALGVKTPDTGKIYDPAGESILQAKVEKYSSTLFSPPAKAVPKTPIEED